MKRFYSVNLFNGLKYSYEFCKDTRVITYTYWVVDDFGCLVEVGKYSKNWVF